MTEKSTTHITSHPQKVVGAISESLNFIAIGELHNSRSAIRFIIDNLNILAPNDRKTYLLTEFLQFASNPHPNLTPEARDERKGASKRNQYSLMKLYEKCSKNNITLESIEHRYGSELENKNLQEKIESGNLFGCQDRCNNVNKIAINKALKIWKDDSKARIIFHAGMNHIANNIYRAIENKSGKTVKEVKIDGITEILKGKGFQGISINIHDPILCKDSDLIRSTSIRLPCYSKHALADNKIIQTSIHKGKRVKTECSVITIDRPDFFLLLTTQVINEGVNIDDTYESIFLSGDKITPVQLKPPPSQKSSTGNSNSSSSSNTKSSSTSSSSTTSSNSSTSSSSNSSTSAAKKKKKKKKGKGKGKEADKSEADPKDTGKVKKDEENEEN